MGSISAGAEKPHALCIPFPAQGHINPMMKLAKLLNQKGFHITFVNTEYNHRRLIKSSGEMSVEGLPSFRFETIPDGLPPSDADTTQDIPALCESLTKNGLGAFRELLAKLNIKDNNNNVPPISCIVSDAVLTYTTTAAKELGIPDVLLWTASPCGYLAYLQFSHLIDKGIIPLKDASLLTNGYLDTVVDWIPGIEGIRWRNFPSFFRYTDPDDFLIKFILQEMDGAKNGSAIILNTFSELEPNVLQALSNYLPPIYTMGPLQLLENQIDGVSLKALETNLWKQDNSCVDWLDSKEANSVVYVNFGSITVITNEQLVEFAWGLANSKQNFLWVIRSDLVSGESVINLPPDMVEETKERCLFVNWCDQELVLSHPSIGGFLSHCGWNSTIESIINGVPMICWPFFAEQQTNCWCCCTKWEIGVEINNDVKRNEVELLVKEVIEGNKGKKMKKKVIQLKSLAEEAAHTTTGGSNKNLEKLIQNVLLSPPNY